MALRPEDLTPEQREEWAARHRSWESGQRALEDPVIRARPEEALRELDEEPQPPPMSPDEFLAITAPPSEWWGATGGPLDAVPDR